MDSEARKVVEIGYGGNERLVMNMGPQHPSAHGVFRALLVLEGETVVGVDAVIGYLHRCHEKLGETLTYVQYPSIASKTDYVAAMTVELAYVSAVELVGKIDVPPTRSGCVCSSPSCSASRRTCSGSAPGAWTWVGRSAAAPRSSSTASANAKRCSISSKRSRARGCCTAFTSRAGPDTTCRRAGRTSAARRSP